MRIYIGATRQNDGKTITCLGLTAALKKRVPNIGYIKPVGQRYVEINGHKIDEDALLIKDVYEVRGQPDGHVTGGHPRVTSPRTTSTTLTARSLWIRC